MRLNQINQIWDYLTYHLSKILEIYELGLVFSLKYPTRFGIQATSKAYGNSSSIYLYRFYNPVWLIVWFELYPILYLGLSPVKHGFPTDQRFFFSTYRTTLLYWSFLDAFIDAFIEFILLRSIYVFYMCENSENNNGTYRHLTYYICRTSVCFHLSKFSVKKTV